MILPLSNFRAKRQKRSTLADSEPKVEFKELVNKVKRLIKYLWTIKFYFNLIWKNCTTVSSAQRIISILQIKYRVKIFDAGPSLDKPILSLACLCLLVSRRRATFQCLPMALRCKWRARPTRGRWSPWRWEETSPVKQVQSCIWNKK